MVSHELVYASVRAALCLLASLGAQGKSLAEDHGLDGTLDVNSAAGHTEPASKERLRCGDNEEGQTGMTYR